MIAAALDAASWVAERANHPRTPRRTTMSDHASDGDQPDGDPVDDMNLARGATAAALYALRRDRGWFVPAAVDMFADRAPAAALPPAVALAFLGGVPDGPARDRIHLACLDAIFDWEQRPDYATREQAELCVWRLAGACWVGLDDDTRADLDEVLAWRLATYAALP